MTIPIDVRKAENKDVMPILNGLLGSVSDRTSMDASREAYKNLNLEYQMMVSVFDVGMSYPSRTCIENAVLTEHAYVATREEVLLGFSIYSPADRYAESLVFPESLNGVDPKELDSLGEELFDKAIEDILMLRGELTADDVKSGRPILKDQVVDNGIFGVTSMSWIEPYQKNNHDGNRRKKLLSYSRAGVTPIASSTQ